LGDLTASQDSEVDERNAILTLSVLVGAISIAPTSRRSWPVPTDSDHRRRRTETAHPEL